jgi:hypothetical protein
MERISWLERHISSTITFLTTNRSSSQIQLFRNGLAQEVDNNDVPNECRDVCASIVTLARQCGDQFGAY